jgi:hypothetical protein
MDSLIDNAERIFNVARATHDSAPGYAADLAQDFAIVIKPDGALHFIMESPFSLEGAASCSGARAAFRVTRSSAGVRVEGRNPGRACVLEERSPHRALLRDQPLYRITSPLLTSGSLVDTTP